MGYGGGGGVGGGVDGGVVGTFAIGEGGVGEVKGERERKERKKWRYTYIV